MMGGSGERRSASDAPGSGRERGGRRDWTARFASVLPYVMLLLFLVSLGWILGDRLLPARELAFETVVVLRLDEEASRPAPLAGANGEDRGDAREETLESGRGAAGAPDSAGDGVAESPEVIFDEGPQTWEGPMRFQASGWIEPDPQPIKAATLVDGTVERVEVLEGDAVSRGQLLATLVDEDARLDLRAAESEADLVGARAARHRREVEGALAERETWRLRLRAAEARREEFADQAQRYARLPKGSVSEGEVTRARLQLATQDAELAALAAEEAEWEARLAALEETGREFEARIATAAVEVERRALALRRTRIESPVDGRVLSLLAVPGEKRRLGMDDPDSATIAILYEPDRLQARIDVPLDEAAGLAVGQAVRIRSSLLPERVFRGRVTRIVGEADLQRNTLQAKVRLDDPDPRLRPGMLCRAEFLEAATMPARRGEGGADGEAGAVVAGPRPERGVGLRVFAPEAALALALAEATGGTAAVWRLDGSGSRVEQIEVRLGGERREGYRLVEEGLRPGDRVVLDPPADLRAGQRVRHRGT